MKIQLDTVNKIIKLENEINLGELVKNLEAILPHGEWKKFTLETHTTIQNWSSPTLFIIEKVYPRRQVEYPWWNGTYCSTTTLPNSVYQSQTGIHNIEVEL